MKRVIVAPSRYVQGPGELENLATYCGQITEKKTFMLVDPYVLEHEVDEIVSGFTSDSYLVEAFAGECSDKEIDRICTQIKGLPFGVVVAIGGGKTIDTGKAVADELGVPIVVVPSIAATDAPTSKHSVIYTDAGVVDRVRFYGTNPALVLVDTALIAKAPTRFLVSGMGDALSTYFEARASVKSANKTLAGGLATRAAQNLARLSYDILLESGLEAKRASDSNLVTPALEDVVEANIYLSGLGFESGGLGAAHALHGGFTTLPETLSYYHGERVAFGVLVQLVLENTPMAEINEVLDFLVSVGLPTTLADIGIVEPSKEKIWQVAEVACAEGETIYNLPVKVTVESTYAAILVADGLGRSRKNSVRPLANLNELNLEKRSVV